MYQQLSSFPNGGCISIFLNFLYKYSRRSSILSLNCNLLFIHPLRLESATLEDWSAEDNLVTGYINSTSSPLLKRFKLKEFVKDCSGLNCDKIVELLNNKLGTNQNNGIMVSMYTRDLPCKMFLWVTYGQLVKAFISAEKY